MDVNPTPFRLSRYLTAAIEIVAYDEVREDRGPAVILTVIDEEETPSSTLGDLADAANQLLEGDALVALLSEGVALASGPIAEFLSAEGIQITRLLPLGYERLTVALVAEKGNLRPVGLPSDSVPLGRPVDWQLDRAYLRISNEHLLMSFRHRMLEGEAAGLRDDLAVARSRISAAESAGGRVSTERDSVAKEHRETLARLRAAESEVRRLASQLENIHGTTAWQAGHALVEAGKNPSRAPAAVKRLLGLWRGRGDQGTATRREPAEPRTLEAEIDGAQLLGALRRLAAVTGDFSACGLIGNDLERLLRACGVHTAFLLPHDPPSSVIGFDMFLIDAAELASEGRWYGAGHPGSPHQDRALIAAVDSAEAAGIPVIVVPSANPLPPGVGTLAPSAIYMSPSARRAVPLGDQRLMTAHVSQRSQDVPLLTRVPWADSWSHGPVLNLNASAVDPIAIGLRHERVAIWGPDDEDVVGLILRLTAAGCLVVTDAETAQMPGVVTSRDLAFTEMTESLDQRLVAAWLNWWEHFSPRRLAMAMTNLDLGLTRTDRAVAILASDDDVAVSATVRERRQLNTVIVVGAGDAVASEFSTAGLDVIPVDSWRAATARVPEDAVVWLPGSRQLAPLLAARGATGADVVQGGAKLGVSSLAAVGSGDLLLSRALLPPEYPISGSVFPTVLTMACLDTEVRQ